MRYTASQLYEKEKTSVCKVITNDGTGTGYIINRRDGIIITNAHVVTDEYGSPCYSCTVDMDGYRTNTTILAYGKASTRFDFAILKADTLPYFATEVKLRHGYLPHHGEEIFIIGYPLGASGTITQGIVNNPDYFLNGEHYILTDTTVNPGNSGGPIYDLEGYVIGTAVAKINTEIITNQNVILSMHHLSEFISCTGINVKSGPYPRTAIQVTPNGGQRTYQLPSAPSNPVPSNPMPSSPAPATPNPYAPPSVGIQPGLPPYFGVLWVNPPNNQFAFTYPIGNSYNMPGPMGYFTVMTVVAHVSYNGTYYILFRDTQTQGLSLFYPMITGNITPVMDSNFLAYVINCCQSQGAIW